MSQKRRRLSTDIQLLEQRSQALCASTSRRAGSIDAELRRLLHPVATVAIGAGAGFLAERLIGGVTRGHFPGSGHSLGRIGGLVVSLVGSLGSAGAAAAASDAAASADAAATTTSAAADASP